MKKLLATGMVMALALQHAAAACPNGFKEFLGACIPGVSGQLGGLPAPVKLNLAPARVYLRPSEVPPRGVGAYGVFALHGRPTPGTLSRLMMACESFVKYLVRQSELKLVPREDQMLTVWPLDNPDAPEVQADKCDYILDHYALSVADSAIADATQQNGDFHGDGPFLIGWSPSDARGKPDNLVLVVDMSGFNSQERFNYAFQFWKEKIVESPELWRPSWSVEGVRLALRDFADRAGPLILKAAHLSGGDLKERSD